MKIPFDGNSGEGYMAGRSFENITPKDPDQINGVDLEKARVIMEELSKRSGFEIHEALCALCGTLIAFRVVVKDMNIENKFMKKVLESGICRWDVVNFSIQLSTILADRIMEISCKQNEDDNT